MLKFSEAIRVGRRRRLIDVGWRCLARTAYSDLTIDDPRREAGASKGAVDVYLPHEEAPLHALLADNAGTVSRAMTELSATERNASRRLRACAADWWRAPRCRARSMWQPMCGPP